MTLEELQQSVDRDLKIDDTELDTESINIPLLHNKYLQHYNKFSLFDLKILKADVHIYMDADEELQRADQKEVYLKQVVSYLEQVLRSINTRNFIIKNAIDWKKFTSGAI